MNQDQVDCAWPGDWPSFDDLDPEAGQMLAEFPSEPEDDVLEYPSDDDQGESSDDEEPDADFKGARKGASLRDRKCAQDVYDTLKDNPEFWSRDAEPDHWGDQLVARSLDHSPRDRKWVLTMLQGFQHTYPGVTLDTCLDADEDYNRVKEFAVSTTVDGYDWTRVHDDLEQLAKANRMFARSVEALRHGYHYLMGLSVDER